MTVDVHGDWWTTTSSASKSKERAPSTNPASPCSMIRKNGSRARKSSMLSINRQTLSGLGFRPPVVGLAGW